MRRTFRLPFVAFLLLAGAIAAPIASTVAGAAAPTAAELAKPGPLPELVIGRDDAPVTIVEYADLTCPHCAAFHREVLPQLKEKYLDTGKARLVFREFPLNTHSLIAFMSVRCAPVEAQLPLIAALFKSQDDWTRAASLPALGEKLFPHARDAGLARAAFDACIPRGNGELTGQQRTLADNVAAVRDRAHNAFGVSSTPTFFVNGEKLSGASIGDFDKAIAAALKP